MKTLFESMRDYQFEKVREQPDKALTEDTRVLTDEDLMRYKLGGGGVKISEQ